MTFTVCLWVIWNGWAEFFLWFTQWSTISDSTRLTDFSNLYQDGKWWLSGAYVNPQTHAIFPYPFAYPPTSLPFFGFFAQFDFGVAAQLWTGICLTVFFVALLSVAVVIKRSRRYVFISIAILLFFTSFALRAELLLGQINLLLEGLTILSLVTYRLKHSKTSATILASATMLKGPPVLFLIYFVIFHKDLRYLFNFLESTAAILGISLLVVPIQLYWTWAVNVLPMLFTAAALPINESVTGAISLSGLSYLTPGVFVAAICMFAAFAYRVTPISSTSVVDQFSLPADAMFLMTALFMLLLGSRSWTQDYVWVIIPAALFLSVLLVNEVRASYFIVVSLATFLFNLDQYPLFTYYLPYYITYSRVAMVPTSLIGNLLMTSALILLFARPQLISKSSVDQLYSVSQYTRTPSVRINSSSTARRPMKGKIQSTPVRASRT
jgi:hypothetical protein